MGYDFCLCVEFDCFFSSDDLSKIPDLIDEMVSKQRKSLVFNPQSHHVSSCNYEEIGPYYCETCFFISEPKFFLNSFAPPKDLSEWVNNHMCYTLEISLFDKLKNYPDLVEFKDCKQHWAIWLKDQSGEFHILINDKSYKQCTYLGCYEGAKFGVVLEKSVFDTIKSYFLESKNEKGNSINKFSTSSNTNLSSLQKV
jgi:hypothetical protein